MLSDRKHMGRVQAACLITVLLMEMLLLLVEGRANFIVWYLLERYLTIPAMIFLGTALCCKQTRQTGAPLVLGGAMILWFIVVQIVHVYMGMDKVELGPVACVYALALPFCAVTEDGQRQYGLRLTGVAVLTGCMMVLAAWALLALGRLPASIGTSASWDGARFSAMGHPNLCATFLMMGIAFSAGFGIRCRKVWCRVLLVVLIALQFGVMSLTNSRTAILITCALLGGLVFCGLRRPDWKGLLTALLAALVVAGGLFALSRQLFRLNESHLTQLALQAQQAGQEVSGLPQLDESGNLIAFSVQSSLKQDMGSLNGRTAIWKALLKALADNSQVRAVGTEYLDLLLEQGGLPYVVGHAHNSWLEILCRRGTVGLILALILTAMALWNAAVLLWRNEDLWKSCIALLSLCLIGCGILEPYLFVDSMSYHFFDFVFMMCLGYMHIWRGQRPKGDSGNV